MVKFRSYLVFFMPMAVFSSHAMGYQYGYYAPNPYNAPQGYYNPYPPAPYPYYPAYRYPEQAAYKKVSMPAQVSLASTAMKKRKEQIDKDLSAAVAMEPEVFDTAIKSATESSDKKQAFIASLLPHIKRENKRLTRLKNKIASIFDKLDRNMTLDSSERQQIAKLRMKYRVKGDLLKDTSSRDELLRKIDIIPLSLALAQAANESAWGQSRFAREANNLFGIWTYDEDKGLKPLKREEGKTHLVRIFDDIGESVRYYMNTLNSHPAYVEMRKIRQRLRVSGEGIDGHELAAGLEKYSARGEEYIDLIQSMIRQNEWARLDSKDPQA